METDHKKLVHQLEWSDNDLPEAQVTWSITQIQLFNFEVEDVSGWLTGCPDGLLQ